MAALPARSTCCSPRPWGSRWRGGPRTSSTVTGRRWRAARPPRGDARGADDDDQFAVDNAIFTAVLDAANECLGRFDARPADDRWCDALLQVIHLAQLARLSAEGLAARPAARDWPGQSAEWRRWLPSELNATPWTACPSAHARLPR